jgi:hypothetical protein
LNIPWVDEPDADEELLPALLLLELPGLLLAPELLPVSRTRQPDTVI